MGRAQFFQISGHHRDSPPSLQGQQQICKDGYASHESYEGQEGHEEHEEDALHEEEEISAVPM